MNDEIVYKKGDTVIIFTETEMRERYGLSESDPIEWHGGSWNTQDENKLHFDRVVTISSIKPMEDIDNHGYYHIVSTSGKWIPDFAIKCKYPKFKKSKYKIGDLVELYTWEEMKKIGKCSVDDKNIIMPDGGWWYYGWEMRLPVDRIIEIYNFNESTSNINYTITEDNPARPREACVFSSMIKRIVKKEVNIASVKKYIKPVMSTTSTITEFCGFITNTGHKGYLHKISHLAGNAMFILSFFDMITSLVKVDYSKFMASTNVFHSIQEFMDKGIEDSPIVITDFYFADNLKDLYKWGVE